MKKLERRDLIAAGGLAAFGAGFSQTLGRMADGVLGEQPERHFEHGRSPEPEFSVDPATGALKMNPKQQVSYTVCQGCTTLCGVRVRIDKESGSVIRVTGNPYNPLSTDPHLPMKAPFKESLVSVSAFKDKGLGGRSTACGRGNAAMDQMNSPFRVLTPLKRVGPRNSGRWEPISFEQLVKEVTEGGDLFGEGHVDGLAKLRDLTTLIDPNAPELGAKVNQVGVVMSVNDGRDFFSQRFWKQAFGTLNYVGHGSYCGGAYRSGSGALFGDMKAMPHGKVDFANAEFAMFVGTAPANAGNPFKRSGALVAKARAQGVLDYVVVDPVLTNADNRAVPTRSHWVPIRPSTDGGLAMGIMRWMFDNNKVNTAYLAFPNQEAAKAGGEPSFTNASWLVIAEKGHPRFGRFVRGTDLGVVELTDEERYKEKDPYFVLDGNGALADAGTLMAAARLEATEPLTIGDKQVAVKTAYQLLRESAQKMTVKQASEITGIPVDVINGLATELTSHGRKACVVSHGGMMGGNGFYNAYALMTLNALIGSLNYKGGFAFNAGGFRDANPGPRYNLATFEGEVKPKGIPLGRNVPYERTSEFKKRKEAGEKPYPAKDQWFPNAPGLATEWFTAALNGYPYNLKALVLWAANPIYGVPGLRPLIDEQLKDPKKLPLIIAIDPLINESSAYADYIVPDSIMYESWGWVAPWAGVPTKTMAARWPVVEPKAEKTPEGIAIGMESFLIALAKKMNLPGFGPAGMSDKDGNPVPLERPEDWYLRGGANVAFAGKEPVGDASDEDIQLSGVERILPLIKSTLKEDEWRKVAFLYTRGGRYQPLNQSQDEANPEWQTWKFEKALWLWNDNLAGAKNSLTGKPYSGCATWTPPAFCDGTPMRDVYKQQDWPLTLVSFKSSLQNSYSIATRITGVHPDNPAIVHPKDAERVGLRTGDMARLQTPGGEAKCTVIVHEGVVPGTVAIEHGYGHKELGARAHRFGDQRQPDRPDLRAGININDIGLQDPTRGGKGVWVDSVSGTSVRNGLPARILRA